MFELSQINAIVVESWIVGLQVNMLYILVVVKNLLEGISFVEMYFLLFVVFNTGNRPHIPVFNREIPQEKIPDFSFFDGGVPFKFPMTGNLDDGGGFGLSSHVTILSNFGRDKQGKNGGLIFGFLEVNIRSTVISGAMYNHILYFSYWLVNFVVILAISFLFPQDVVLGTWRFTAIEGAIYTSFWLTFWVWLVWDFLYFRGVRFEKSFSTWVYFFAVNTVGIWIIARVSNTVGMGISWWGWALILGFFANWMQRVAFGFITKRQLKIS